MQRIITKAIIIVAIITIGVVAPRATTMIPSDQQWSFEGPFGTFDRAQLQRGFQVYKQVCASCHSIKLISYRNLAVMGFNRAEIKAIAKEYIVTDGPNDEGEMYERAAIPTDHFVSPFANEQAARAANNGAFPPDLSVIAKARKHGIDYVYALLMGYQEQPPGMKVDEGLYYNRFFSGNQIAMAPPLSPDLVSYSDGTRASVAQMAKDVSAFLAWASEPEMEERKRTGIMVMIYLFFLTGFLYFAMQRIWLPLKSHPPNLPK